MIAAEEARGLRDKWCQVCPVCDAGLPMACSHPIDEDPRSVISEALVTVITQAEEIAELQDRLDGQAWEDLTAERDRFKAGLKAIQADKDRNKWHPGTKFPPAGRNWHDGYITALSSHWLLAERYLDPEAAAEGDRRWRMGSQATDEEWWQATGHCGGCGDVGSACACDGKCGCADLHGPRLPDWKSASQLLAEALVEVAALRAQLSEQP